MSSRRRATIPAFTPTSVPPAELAARTVGRTGVVERIVQRIRDAAISGDRSHLLIVGPRGSGKTHVLCVATHEAARDEEVARRVVFVTLPEDAQQVVSYEDLLFAIVEDLAGREEAERSDQTLHAALASRRAADGLERLVLDLLNTRVLAVVVENLDRMFHDFGPSGQSQLRAFVESSRQILLVASTPLLFSAVSDHSEPWYGAFDPIHLSDLTMEDGAELLRRIAHTSGDRQLAEFLERPEATARLRAVTDLTGGSPRMWTVLSGCMTVELLDELVPLVQTLLDDLVPYYQERLGSLPANERKLVVEMCRTTEVVSGGKIVRRMQGMRNVNDLAQACGIKPQVAATSLKRLAEKRWVKRTKRPGTDQRTTWYEIREPLLRHHLQYRESRGETLRVIVSFLRDLYSAEERLRYLADVRAESIAERYLRVVANDGVVPASNEPFAIDDPERLLAGVRCWIDDAGTDAHGRIASRLAGAAGEAAALTVRDGKRSAEAAARRRIAAAPAEQRSTLETVLRAAIAGSSAAQADAGSDRRAEDAKAAGPQTDARIAIARGLQAALVASAEVADPVDHVTLAFLTAGWTRHVDVDQALELLVETLPVARSIELPQVLRWAVEAQDAIRLADAADGRAALELLSNVRIEQERHLGPDHLDTLASRYWVAVWQAETGEPEHAARALRALVGDYERVLGAGHQETLATAVACAQAISDAGDVDGAYDVLAEAARRARGEDATSPLFMPFAFVLATVALQRGHETHALGIAADLRRDVSARAKSADHIDALLIACVSALPPFRAQELLTADELADWQAAFELAPEIVLVRWASATVDPPSGAVSTAIATIIESARHHFEPEKLSQRMMVTLLLGVQLAKKDGAEITPSWLLAWRTMIGTLDPEPLAFEVIDAMHDAINGDERRLAALPEELRESVGRILQGQSPAGEKPG